MTSPHHHGSAPRGGAPGHGSAHAPGASNTHGHGHAHGHGHGHGGAHPDDDACAEVLDLDAVVFAGLLADVVARVVAHAPRPTRTVVDLGAGTGTGTLALARALPGARVVAVDASPAMLARLRAAADRAGVGDRVSTVEADLDAGWPDVGTADLVWASASLHHVADPDRVLRDAHDALAPGGLVAVVEMSGVVPDLPDVGTPGLTDRLAAATAHAGWNRYPDWTPFLGRAGLELVERVELRGAAAPGPDATRWVRTTLDRQREHLAEHLAPGDAEAIAAFLDRLDRAPSDDPGDPLPPVRSGRVLWTARRPAAPLPPGDGATRPGPDRAPAPHAPHAPHAPRARRPARRRRAPQRTV